jgi:hypothetical protein
VVAVAVGLLAMSLVERVVLVVVVMAHNIPFLLVR